MKSIQEIQAFVLSTAQLEERGLNRQQLQRQVRQGALQKIRRGSYAPSDWWENLQPSDKYLASLVAHQQHMGPKTLFSHHSAAALHGLAQLTIPQQIHLAAPRGRANAREGIKVHQLGERKGIILHQLPVTNLLSTVLDCVASCDPREGLVLADSALAKGLAQEDLLEALQQAQGRGCRKARLLAPWVSPLSESAGESLVRYFLLTRSFPPAEQQYWVRQGSRRYRLDFAWPSYGVLLEFDGNIKYQNYRPREQAFLQQNEREAWLRSQGWQVVRTNWKEVLYRPHLLEQRLRQALGI